MRRLAVLATLALAVLAGTARAGTFAVVPTQFSLPTLTGLPSADAPNLPGAIAVPTELSTPPAVAQQLSYPQLEAIWQRAGAAYGIPWQVLGSINKIESNWGRNMGPSSAGAIGWMQFMPSTWLRWGTDANGDGVADPWNAEDAILAAARYLAAAGGGTDIARAVFAYNHADWYVKEVLDLAGIYTQGGAVAFSLDRLQVELQRAEKKVVAINRELGRRHAVVRRLAGTRDSWAARERSALLLSDRLAAGKRAALAAFRHDDAVVEDGLLRGQLVEARAALEQARLAAQGAAFASGASNLLQAPSYAGDYVFPVGGGPQVVSVGHTHHDYPAADIGAPAGSPVYAVTNGIVVRAWHEPDPRCGIGLTMQAADGQVWTYCHLAYEEPSVQTGVQVAAGAPIGLVGSTGDATGPHLHLQLEPATAYPQDEGWFQAFAGTAFAWQDGPTAEPTRALAVSSSSAPVFRVLPAAEPAVVLFTR